jgi:hypothetical protein
VSSSKSRAAPNSNLTELPSPFEWLIYVNHPSNGDLKGFTESEATHHYMTFGRDEGRIASQIDSRSAFLGIIPKDCPLLEIGPFCTPSFSPKNGPVRYLDVFSTTELRDIAAELSWGKPDEVPEVDYVWNGSRYSELINERYDVVFSSHNIEHQPCLVTHLQNIASIMRPGRRLFLIIPDRRYCFDYYLAESTIADVLDAFVACRSKHKPGSILEHRLLLTHNEPKGHWDGNHGPDTRRRLLDPAFLKEVETSLLELPSTQEYIDTHAWHFTPDSFSYIVSFLKASGLVQFDIEGVYPTIRPTNEFFVVLRLAPDKQGRS